MAALQLSATLGGGPCLLSSVGDRNVPVIVSRHTLFYWIKTKKKVPVLYYSKKYINREPWCAVREVWGARREPPLYSCARWCFVTRRRGSWAIAIGITKKRIDDADARGRRCGVAAWLSLPIWHLEYRYYQIPGNTAGITG